MNKNSKKKSGQFSTTLLRREFSNLSNFFQSINSRKDIGKKMKQNRSIKPHHYNFITSKNLGKLSSFDTLEKKKSSRKKKKNFRNKSISQRIVTNFNSEKEVCVEKGKKSDNHIFLFESKDSGLSLKNNLPEEYPKLDVVKSALGADSSPENYLFVPLKLKKELDILSIKIIYPVDNKNGKYTKYVQNVSKSIRDFIGLDYDSIFSIENSNNVKYLEYESETYNNTNKKLLLLDLDETLIHSEFRDNYNYKSLDKMKAHSKCYHRSFSYIENNYKYYFDIYFRPFLFDFLHEIKNYFDLAIFTASTKGYADTIINYIDPNNEIFKFRLYREACIPIQKYLYIKDLRIIKNYNPMKVIIMDNSLYSFINQPSNGMLIYSFYSNHKDNQLIYAKNFLIKYLYPANDVRTEIEKWFHFSKLLGKKCFIENDNDDEDEDDDNNSDNS